MRALRRAHARDLPGDRAQEPVQVLRVQQPLQPPELQAGVHPGRHPGGAASSRRSASSPSGKDVISALVDDYVAHNRKALPELEEKREAILQDLASLGAGEAEALPLAARYRAHRPGRRLRQRPDRRALREGDPAAGAAVGDRRTRSASSQKQTYNAEAISDQLKEFVAATSRSLDARRAEAPRGFPGSSGWRSGKTKGWPLALRPPFAFGFLSPALAPRGIEPLFEE